MTSNAPPEPLASLLALEDRLQNMAARSDHSHGHLRDELALLESHALCRAPLPIECGGAGWSQGTDTALTLFRALRCLGRANLSLGRLFEGHLNAIKLILLYGDAALVESVSQDVHQGHWYGVWGADSSEPVIWDGGRLKGRKRFASGLGMISRAVITTRTEGGLQLVLARCTDAERMDASGWTMSGMRATQSGTYDFTNVEGEAFGHEGDYLKEPWFEGGVWRYCAVHLGGAERLRDLAYRSLRDRNPVADAALLRLNAMAISCETMRLWLEQAATCVEGMEGEKRPKASAAYALLARDVTERGCGDVTLNATRCVGTSAFDETGAFDRVRRDLSLFLRQADLDGKALRSAASLLDNRGAADVLCEPTLRVGGADPC